MSELSIKVTLAGRIYPLTVKAEEEEMVREAAKRVDDQVKRLQNSYAVRDKQDLLAMTALQMSSQISEHERTPKSALSDESLNQILERVEQLNKI